MENKQKEPFNHLLRERTLNFATQVQSMFQRKKIPLINRSMVVQVIRSATSVAANYRAASRARSDAEYYAKLCIVVEECDETQFWLDFLVRTGVLEKDESVAIQQEVVELVRIFTAMKKKMKDRLQR